MPVVFAEVAILGTALETSLHYSVPEEMEDLRPGCIVSVLLGRRSATGVVLSLSEAAPDLPENITIRPILGRPDSRTVVPPDILALCRWISTYYFYPMGEVLSFTIAGKEAGRTGKTGAPAAASSSAGGGVSLSRQRMVRLTGKAPPLGRKDSEGATALLKMLEEAGCPVSIQEIRACVKNSDYWLRKFARGGVIAIEEREESIEPPPDGRASAERALLLTLDQRQALDIIAPHLETPAFGTFVLYGVTGSGKTEIYIQLVEKAVQFGKGALVLVPEIALSTQMEAIFRERFGPALAVWHSALSPRDRRRDWNDILDGKKTIVLGARSAILTPVQNLGLIIVDEEHDPAYKQEDRLRYNARDVALVRSKILDVPVVLGSATPSLQTVHRFRSEQYRLVSLPSRIFGRAQPDLEIVDMRREGRGGRIFSAKLRDGIARVLEEGRQAVLFLNRRGFAKYYLCNSCGHVLQCISCSLTLTYHQKENCLRCHYCGWQRELPQRCPVCEQAALFAHGYGTERLEKEVERLFPNAGMVRFDRDAIRSHEKLVSTLDAVRSGRADIIVGTQMIAKGHDFPNITLVGIINADAGLQVPDFRAGENLVQLLFQVSGRAGRGEDPGRVILQTYNPYHYTVDALLKMDYDGFCDNELESRKVLQYPPYTRLLKFLVTSGTEEAARTGARLLAVICREKAASLKEAGRHIAVLGPSPAAYVKLKNRFRWQVFIKTWQSSDMQFFAESVIASVKADAGFRQVQVTVDRDPASDL
ncbi:MAG: primosomal protein N' [Syntrophobacteraceae bacterium]